MASECLTAETGEISTEKLPFMYVKWKVPENILLPKAGVHMIYSPGFHFNGATWKLRLMVFTSAKPTILTMITKVRERSYDLTYLQLVKMNPTASTLRVNYTIGIKTVSGDTYECQRGETASKFERDSNFCGMFALRRSEMSQKNLAPNGIVTLFCNFWIETVENLDESLGYGLRMSLCGCLDVSPSRRLFEEQLKKKKLVTENAGEISTESSLLTYVEWDVPSNLLLSQSINFTITSPRFQFKDAKWFLQMIINDREFKEGTYSRSDGTNRRIDLHLVEKVSVDDKLRVHYSVGIKTLDGSTHFTQHDECVYQENVGLQVWLTAMHKDLLITTDGFVTFFFYFLLERLESLDAVSTTKMPEGYATQKPTSLTSSSNASSSSTSDCTPEKPQTSSGLEKLVTDFKNLFVASEECDVTFRVKNKEFKDHKCILRARSTVFYSMYAHDMTEKNSGIIDIPDCDPGAFQIFLLYLYSGNVETLSSSTAFDLYGIADKYDTEELKIKCKEFILTSLSVDTVCDVLEHAIQFDDAELLATTTDFFAKNFKNVILTDKWQSFLKNNPVETNKLLIKASNYYILEE